MKRENRTSCARIATLRSEPANSSSIDATEIDATEIDAPTRPFEESGFVEPVKRAPTSRSPVIGVHHRLKAALRSGPTEVPSIYLIAAERTGRRSFGLERATLADCRVAAGESDGAA